MSELHKLAIAHQDLKPSNVLIFPHSGANIILPAKITDLGRSSHKDTSVWHNRLTFAGDPQHAPIEFFYNFTSSDWTRRRIAGDLYMIGSFAAFLFTGASMTALLNHYLPIDIRPKV